MEVTSQSTSMIHQVLSRAQGTIMQRKPPTCIRRGHRRDSSPTPRIIDKFEFEAWLCITYLETSHRDWHNPLIVGLIAGRCNQNMHSAPSNLTKNKPLAEANLSLPSIVSAQLKGLHSLWLLANNGHPRRSFDERLPACAFESQARYVGAQAATIEDFYLAHYPTEPLPFTTSHCRDWSKEAMLHSKR
jgi:hypothetical protein